MPDDSAPENVARDCVSWANGDSTKIDALSPAIDVYNPGLPDGEVHDRTAWRRYLHETRAGFPDLRFDIEELLAGDDVVMAELTATGTHEGDFRGIPPTGREIEFRVMVKLVVENGSATEWHECYDTQQPPKQLGLTFPAVIGQLPKLAWRKLRATA